MRWQAASLGIHFDGSVTVVMAVGGHPQSSGAFGKERQFYGGHCVSERVVEGAIADLMGLIRAVAFSTGAPEYEVRVGIKWDGGAPLSFYRQDQYGLDEDAGSVPVHRFIPVETTVEVRDNDDEGYLQQVRELALDCINQGVASSRVVYESGLIAGSGVS